MLKCSSGEEIKSVCKFQVKTILADVSTYFFHEVKKGRRTQQDEVTNSFMSSDWKERRAVESRNETILFNIFDCCRLSSGNEATIWILSSSPPRLVLVVCRRV